MFESLKHGQSLGKILKILRELEKLKRFEP